MSSDDVVVGKKSSFDTRRTLKQVLTEHIVRGESLRTAAADVASEDR